MCVSEKREGDFIHPFLNDVFTTRPLLIKRAKIRLERDVSYYRHVSIQTRALRGCDDDHFFLSFSFSFLSAHTKRAAARPSSSWCCFVRVLFCAFQLYHLLVVSLFLSKVFGVCIGPETTPTRRGRDDRDEKEPTTDEKASSTKPFASRVSIRTY